MEDYTDRSYYKTYDEWQEEGYHVIKGQKAVGRNELGLSVFYEDQVEEDYDY